MWVGGSQIDPELGRPAATSLAGAGSAGAGKDGKIPVRACWSDPTQGIPSVSQRENIGLSCKQETPNFCVVTGTDGRYTNDVTEASFRKTVYLYVLDMPRHRMGPAE